MLMILIVALVVYIAMIFLVKYRTAIASMGIGILLIYGIITGTYSTAEAFRKFPTELVVLIITLALFSKIFKNNGFLQYIGHGFLKLSKGRKIIIAILIPFIIYAASLFMNNLSVILLFTFICIELAIQLNIPVVPILVSGVIASNIGGCSLPWSDTPSVILTLYSDFNVLDFLTKLFLPCAAYIALLILYTIWWFKREDESLKKIHGTTKLKIHNDFLTQFDAPPSPPHIVTKIDGEFVVVVLPPSPPPPHVVAARNAVKWKRVYLPIVLFIIYIFGICVAPFLNISIAYISMIFIGIMLFLSAEKPEAIVNSLPVLDSIVFISALFMIAGVLEEAGILKAAINYILSFTGGNKVLILVCIMVSAFVIATFLSAGPAAATILPICTQLSPLVGHKLVYAALALGILAGSSMLPWSSIGGSVMLSEVSRYLHHHIVWEEDKKRINEIYNFKHYIAFSIPFSLVILGLSAIFLVIYSMI